VPRSIEIMGRAGNFKNLAEREREKTGEKILFPGEGENRKTRWESKKEKGEKIEKNQTERKKERFRGP